MNSMSPSPIRLRINASSASEVSGGAASKIEFMSSAMYIRRFAGSKAPSALKVIPPGKSGTPVMANGKEAGEICTGIEDRALALLRLDRSAEAAAEGIPLTAGKATLRLPENGSE